MFDEVENEGQAVGIIRKMDLFGGDAFHSVGEIGDVSTVEDNHYNVGNQINGI